MENTDEEELSFQMRCVEDYTLESYAEVEDGEVVQKTPKNVHRTPLEIHSYQIQLLTDEAGITILTELCDKNVAMKLLILLDEGIWTLEDLDEYTNAEVLDTYHDKLGHHPLRETFPGDQIHET
jgi:hypothetical protein